MTSAPAATAHGATLTWNDPSLAAGASITYDVTFTVDGNAHTTVALGGVTESAVRDPVPANNAAIVGVRLG